MSLINIRLCCRYRTWTEGGEGRTACVRFQKKHWFDTDVTIEWLNWLHEQFPGKKIGLIWDHAPAHVNKVIAEYLRRNTSWLTTSLIPGGLTSVLQVCDLIINKKLKQNIRELYYRWRAPHVRSLRESGVKGRVDIKIPRDTLIDICEKSVKKLNLQERLKPTIRKMFRKAGQDPFFDCSELFKQHLDSLSKDAMYKSIIHSQTAEEL